MTERERIALGMEASEIGVQGGIRGPLTLRRSCLVENGMNALMARGANVVTLANFLDGALHVAIFVEVILLKSVWNRVGKGLRGKLRWNPRDLQRGWNQARRGNL